MCFLFFWYFLWTRMIIVIIKCTQLQGMQLNDLQVISKPFTLLSKLFTFVINSVQISSIYGLRQQKLDTMLSLPAIRWLITPIETYFRLDQYFLVLIAEAMRQGSYFLFYRASFDAANTKSSLFSQRSMIVILNSFNLHSFLQTFLLSKTSCLTAHQFWCSLLW